jgi:enoyl-[acyl-carrier-protein] reductase (NADH)
VILDGKIAVNYGGAATLEDVGNVAAFAASDHARSMTGRR